MCSLMKDNRAVEKRRVEDEMERMRKRVEQDAMKRRVEG